jgi:hypothetical protein
MKMSPAIQTAPGNLEVQIGRVKYELTRMLFVGRIYRETTDDPSDGEVVAWLVSRGGYHITTIDGELDAVSAPQALRNALDLLAD